MQQRVYMVYDMVAKEAGPLVCCKNNGVALRMFSQLIKETGNPEDYCLYQVGEYFTDTGCLLGFVDEKVKVVENCEVEE